MVKHQFLATCPAGVGVYLAQELQQLGAEQIVDRPVGVSFIGGLAMGYRACLWSRLANRIVLQLTSAEAASIEAFYDVVYAIDWQAHIPERGTFMVDFAGRSDFVRNPQFGAQRAKDAIVDRFRALGRGRPSVNVQAPDVRVTARLAKGRLTLGIDLSGDSLHRRGYRLDGGLAPIKENVAAAALWAASWPDRSREGESVIDPMCGSGTLLLEAALIALDKAPGLLREGFGFDHWLGHDPAQWGAVKSEAIARASAPAPPIEIRGYDGDIGAVRRAQDNIARLGLDTQVRVSCKGLSEISRPTHREMGTGLLIVNPPWGERMGNKQALPHLYSSLGELMSSAFNGWHAVVLTSEIELGKAIGLRARKRHRFHNGRLDLHCLQFELNDENQFRPFNRDTKPHAELGGSQRLDVATGLPKLSEGANAVANRLRKNQRRLKGWLAAEGVTCFRVYDADIPEYAAAIDCYNGAIHVAEYVAPQEVPEEKSIARLEELLDAVQVVFKIFDRSEIGLKRRSRQRGREQYQRQNNTGARFTVAEGPVKLLVNLHDYLDTGLFLDHRPLRTWIGREAKGRHFLNLFSYTGVATLHAAIGGAVTSTSVDASATYLDWFSANLAVNGLSDRQHRAVRADVREWLAADSRFYDVIMLDPPSFSNSRGQEDFDIQADHLALLKLAMARLAPDGILYFSTNRRRFKLSDALPDLWRVEDVTAASIPKDFERNARIHYCWRISYAQSPGVNESIVRP